MAPLLLAADIGGTHTRMALFRQGALVDERRVRTLGPGLLPELATLLAGRRPDAACFAVAGPVHQGQAQLTNHHWTFDEGHLAEELRCPVRLANDFEAAARGIPALPANGWRSLNGLQPKAGDRCAVMGAGTGLGTAFLLPTGRIDRPWAVQPTEGGHTDFAPADALQAELWASLHDRYGHVSWERLLSGEGLVNLQAFFRERGLSGPVTTLPSEVGEGRDEASQAAIALFCRLLGQQAGNLALLALPAGGVWICGGIAPRFDLGASGLLEAFADKGRMARLVAATPLLLVTDDRLGMLGAAAMALELI